MKLFFKIISCIIIFQFLFSSCHDTIKENGIKGNEVSILIKMKIPSINNSQTRAVEESTINNVDILVFQNLGTGYEYSYTAAGYSISSGGENTYNFNARITASNDPLKLYFIANATGLNGLFAGASEEDVKSALIQNFTTAGFENYLPMFGEQEFISGLTTNTNPEINITMLRSVARADIRNEASNFRLNSVYVYRANNQLQLIPDAILNDRVIAPSVPSGAERNINQGPFITTGETLTEQIYLPESYSLSTLQDQLTATAIVVGGYYENETIESYYRMDFVPDEDPEAFGQILRNHLYNFTISAVEGSGWRTPDEAANNNSSQITAEIKAWNESTMYMVFDQVNYFGVSSRVIEVPSPVGSQKSILVDTSLDTYELYWTDEDGNIDESIGPITLGESFTSSDSLFTVTISPDGTRITATAHSTGSNRGYLLARAGRLSVTLIIQQGVSNLIYRALNVLGTLTEIGSLGDYVLGADTSSARERAGGMMRIMRNTTNFGPGGTIPIEKINIAGRADYNFTSDFIRLFDVLYLTYLSRDTRVSAQNYVNWLNASNRRVMIVHYDNGTTNENILSLLGVTPILNLTDPYPAYKIYYDAPEIILQGPFGAVDTTAAIRCFDNAFGEIDLQFALNNGISPVILGKRGGVLLGIDFERRIVYSGDIDLYNNIFSSVLVGDYIRPNSGGTVVNNSEKIIANLWAWIAQVVLSQEENE